MIDGMALDGIAPAIDGGEEADQPLPDLRQELALHPGPVGRGGEATWTLSDPSLQKFYRIGQKTMEVLSRWNQGTAAAVAAKASAESVYQVSPEDVIQVRNFLEQSNLVRPEGAAGLAQLQRRAAALHSHWLIWLVKNYLFLRVPLLRPEGAIKLLYRWIAWVYSGPARLALVAAGALGLFLAARQWGAFQTSFSYLFSFQGLGLFLIALVFAKIVHEFGHAFTAHRYGCRVSAMGLALLVLWPVLYTDVSDAWKLPSRRARMAIGMSGIAFELGLAVIATLVWSILPDGALRGAVFLLATTTWVGTVAINLSPFMKFDGYYVLSDWLGIDNLFDRAFKMGRWKLREILFRLGEAPPEAFDRSRARFLVLFAWGVWLYRFLLFLGIALLVYFLFFKALGLILMTVELVWFIAMPIYNELREWGRRRGRFRLNLNTLVTLSLFGLLAALFLLPLDAKVDAPGVLRAEKHTDIYAPFSARITKVEARIDQRVTAQQPLFRLTSPALEKELAAVRKKAGLARRQLELASADINLRHRRLVAETELAALNTRIEGLAKSRAKLVINAPMEAVVTGIAAPKEGQWVGANDLLVGLNALGSVIEAYVAEADVGRIGVGAMARFIPENLDQPVRRGTVMEIDALNTAELTRPILASIFGGDIPVRNDKDGRLIPERSIYKVLINIDRSGKPVANAKFQLRGVASIAATKRSFGANFWALAAGIMVRESGF